MRRMTAGLVGAAVVCCPWAAWAQSPRLDSVVREALEKACLASSDPSTIEAAAKMHGWPSFERLPNTPGQIVIASRRQIENGNLILSIWRDTSNSPHDGVDVVQCSLSFDRPRNAEMIGAAKSVLGEAQQSGRMSNGSERWWGFVVRHQEKVPRQLPVFDEKVMVAATHSIGERLLGVQVWETPGPSALITMWYTPPKRD